MVDGICRGIPERELCLTPGVKYIDRNIDEYVKSKIEFITDKFKEEKSISVKNMINKGLSEAFTFTFKDIDLYYGDKDKYNELESFMPTDYVDIVVEESSGPVTFTGF